MAVQGKLRRATRARNAGAQTGSGAGSGARRREWRRAAATRRAGSAPQLADPMIRCAECGVHAPKQRIAWSWRGSRSVAPTTRSVTRLARPAATLDERPSARFSRRRRLGHPPRRKLPSPNFEARPGGIEPTLIVVHNISLPPDEFGGTAIAELFQNRLDYDAHPYYDRICAACGCRRIS